MCAVLGLEPSFDVPIVNVTVVAGQTAVLPCSVDSLGKYKVRLLVSKTSSLTLHSLLWHSRDVMIHVPTQLYRWKKITPSNHNRFEQFCTIILRNNFPHGHRHLHLKRVHTLPDKTWRWTNQSWKRLQLIIASFVINRKQLTKRPLQHSCEMGKFFS